VLELFLNAKPLFYDEIDYTRMPRVYKRIKEQLPLPKIIHLVGTNGKGTTGRFLASALYSMGFCVGHYSSPHIVAFNERIWLDGENISDDILESAHKKLQNLLKREESDALSYFEYTTLLAIIVYEKCDYVVLEAGLGGEHDATAVFENMLTLITPVGMDHEAFLGNTIEKIATTKLHAVQKAAILSAQNSTEVRDIAREMSRDKGWQIFEVETLLQDEDKNKIVQIAEQLTLAPYLQENLKLAIAALKYLKLEYRAEFFYKSRLFGRLSEITQNILLDVGHNVLAASAIAKSLKGEKYRVIYNSYRDKNYKEILSILKPIIERIEIIKVEDSRIEKPELLKEALSDLGIEYMPFKEIEEKKRYLVFGSFSVAEAFLKGYRG